MVGLHQQHGHFGKSLSWYLIGLKWSKLCPKIRCCEKENFSSIYLKFVITQSRSNHSIMSPHINRARKDYKYLISGESVRLLNLGWNGNGLTLFKIGLLYFTILYKWRHYSFPFSWLYAGLKYIIQASLAMAPSVMPKRFKISNQKCVLGYLFLNVYIYQ